MRCPRCNETGTRVIDSRDLEGGSTIRRRRECEACAYRFTTYERPEGARLTVLKRDGSRQEFDRNKLQAGLLKALEKRPVTLERVEQAVDEIEGSIRSRGEAEISSKEIATPSSARWTASWGSARAPRGKHRVILSDRDIRSAIDAGRIVIDPFSPDAIQPSSIDLHVDRRFRVFRNSRYPFIDVREEQPDLTELVEIDAEQPFILHPGEFVLGSTLERVVLPDDLVARLEGKSSLGRLGLLIHSTAGYVDPGWDGNLTLELSNVANLPITLYYGMKIGQISFQQMSSPVEVAYGDSRIGSKYRGQRDPTASLYHRDFDRGRLLPGEGSRNRG